MVDPAANPVSPRPADRRLGDTLGAQARQKPEGGRAKWIVWAIFAVPVLVIGILQMFNVLKNPVAEKVLERRRSQQQQRQPERPDDPAPGPTEPGK